MFMEVKADHKNVNRNLKTRIYEKDSDITKLERHNKLRTQEKMLNSQLDIAKERISEFQYRS